MKVLIIDNEEFIRNIMKDICGMIQGCECSFAVSGAEAVNVCGTSDFDLLLVDFTLDDTDGAELMKKLRKNGVDADSYLITGWDKGHFTEEQLEPFNGVIQKPFDINRIMEVLRG